MQSIIAPIAQNQVGIVAENLIECILYFVKNNLLKVYEAPNNPTQDEISALIAGAKLELAQKIYGKNSQRLMFYFQMQNGLGDHMQGGIDENTANTVNKVLSELCAIIETSYRVTGIITCLKTQAALANVKVRAFDADGAVRTFLGHTRTDAAGAYRIEFNSSAFKNSDAEIAGPDLIIEVFNEDGDVSFGKSARHNNCKQETVIDLAVTIPGLRVFGTVTNFEHQPQNNIIVTAWDRDLRTRQMLGSAKTDGNGNYVIEYSADGFAAADVAGRDKPWLIVEAQQHRDHKIELSVSITPDKVERYQRVDLVIESLSEWDQINYAVSPLLVGQADDGEDLPPYALTENDCEFIVIETAISNDNIGFWSSAHAMQRNALDLLGQNHPSETEYVATLGSILFYGVSRQFCISALQDLFSKPADTIESALNNAVAQKQIPFVESADIVAFAALLALLSLL